MHSTKTRFCLSLHYNRKNRYLFVNGTETIKFKVIDTEIVANLLCLGNISEDISVDSMSKTGLIGPLCDLSVDYDAIAVDDLFDIQKLLLK